MFNSFLTTAVWYNTCITADVSSRYYFCHLLGNIFSGDFRLRLWVQFNSLTNKAVFLSVGKKNQTAYVTMTNSPLVFTEYIVFLHISHLPANRPDACTFQLTLQSYIISKK